MSNTSALWRIGPYVLVPLVMIVVEVVVAAFVAAAWEPPAAADFLQKVQAKKPDAPPKFTADDFRSDLGLSRDGAWFGGLPFNGRLLDPKLMALWMLERKGIHPGDYDKKDLDALSKKVEDSFTWRHALMRWVYRAFGSDFIGFAMLTLSYGVFVFCLREYWRLARHFGRLHGFWQSPDPLDEKGRPRKEALRTVDRGQPWRPAEVYLQRREGDARERAAADDTGDGDRELLPHKLLRAAIRARKLYPGQDEREVARRYYRDLAAQIMEGYENRLGRVQYFAQIIAPLGFIGTVLHLGLAMGHAQSLTEGGGIGAVTSSLGMAFDTTFVALVLWIVVEFLAMRERTFSRLRVRDEAEERVRQTVFAPNAPGAADQPAVAASADKRGRGRAEP